MAWCCAKVQFSHQPLLKVQLLDVQSMVKVCPSQSTFIAIRIGMKLKIPYEKIIPLFWFWVWLSALFIIQSNHLTLCRYQAISSRARQQNFAPQGISKLDSARSLDTLTVLNIQTWENDKDLNNGCKNGILPNQITFQLEVWKIVDHKNHLATDSQIANFDPLELLTFTNPALT